MRFSDRPNRGGEFRRETLRHVLNFLRHIVSGVASCVLDARERDRSEARDVVAVGESVKTIGAVRRIEGGAHARFGDDDVKVASGWMLHGNIALI